MPPETEEGGTVRNSYETVLCEGIRLTIIISLFFGRDDR